MTIDMFFKKFAQLNKKMNFRLDAFGAVRAQGNTCPVCAVAGLTGSDLELAGKLTLRPEIKALGLQRETINALALAADTEEMGEVITRRYRWRMLEIIGRGK